jgi:hypothetical protein
MAVMISKRASEQQKPLIKYNKHTRAMANSHYYGWSVTRSIIECQHALPAWHLGRQAPKTRPRHEIIKMLL